MIELTEIRHYTFTEDDIIDTANKMIECYSNNISLEEINEEIDELLAFGCDDLKIDTTELVNAIIKQLGDKYESN